MIPSPFFPHDPDLAKAIAAEYTRQQTHIELIASENFVSKDILAAQGSILTNKYAEGYPGRRYYGGCFAVDQVENLAIQRVTQLFSCAFANVQPHSGSQANQAVFLALLSPGDCILSMDLASGGHLTHGSPVNLAGKWFRIVPYGVDHETGLIDYEAVRKLAETHRPRLIIAGASAYPRHIDFSLFRKIADDVGAYLLVDMAHISGLVAADCHPSPIPHAHVITSTTHKTLRGPRGGFILSHDKDMARKINQAIFPGLQGGPLMHVIGAKAACFREALEPSFKDYGKQILLNSQALARCLLAHGFSLTTGGTDNHLMVVNLKGSTLSGHQAEKALDAIGITCNKNGVPQDPLPPLQTSGIRLGTAAMTTRGFKEAEMEQVGQWIAHRLRHPDECPDSLKAQVTDLCLQYPLDTLFESQYTPST